MRLLPLAGHVLIYVGRAIYAGRAPKKSLLK
jgi:hypothetical protein